MMARTVRISHSFKHAFPVAVVGGQLSRFPMPFLETQKLFTVLPTRPEARLIFPVAFPLAKAITSQRISAEFRLIQY
jgi:hypothetical protein